jgi:hypothetical protein
MMDLNNEDNVWPENLKPIFNDELEKEKFSAWWERNQHDLTNLPKEVYEQWIYRHWKETTYKFLHLERLTCSEEAWHTEKLKSSLGIWDGGPINCRDHKYCSVSFDDDEVFKYLHDREPWLSFLQHRTWNIPIVVLSNKQGFQLGEQAWPNITYWLIEGHKRMRCLNVFSERYDCANTHKVFVMSIKSK